MPKLSALERLEKKQAELKAQIQNLKARTRKESERQQTRRKILVGAYYLEQAEKTNTYEDIRIIMSGFLTRNSDRTLFDLPLLEETQAQPEVARSHAYENETA